MSSHHFVKEGQEPCLFIVDALSQSQAESFLEWSPLVMVHEKAVEDVLLWGIKIDVVLASNSHVNTLAERLAEQTPIKIIADANPDDLTAALWLLVRLKQSAAYVLVADPDPIFNNPSLPVEHLQVNLVTKSVKWSHVPSGTFKKWLAAGTELHVRGLSGQEEMTGLRIQGANYVVKAEGSVQIVNPSPFWVGELL